MTNNRITVLSTSIVEAHNLKILDVEGNPIVFPPKGVVKKKKGVSDEEWLVELRGWLMENGGGKKKREHHQQRRRLFNLLYLFIYFH